MPGTLPQVLMVLTSHGRIDADHPTGLWLEEFAEPYLAFVEAGCRVTVASIAGGVVPVDPRSLEGIDAHQWPRERERLQSTLPLTAVVGHFDALFLPGGHGTMFDLPENRTLQGWITHLLDVGRPVAAVCHGPAGLTGVQREDGRYLVAGRRLTGFTNAEEQAVQLDRLMPFLLESRLREEGALFQAGPLWQPHVLVDGMLVTGQNPASSRPAAEAVLELLRGR